MNEIINHIMSEPVKKFRAASEELIDKYIELVETNCELKKQLNQTKEELTNDKIKELENQCQRLRNCAIDIFPSGEVKKWNDFKTEHTKKCDCYSFMHESGSTAIMNYFSIKCKKCGEEITIYA